MPIFRCFVKRRKSLRLILAERVRSPKLRFLSSLSVVAVSSCPVVSFSSSLGSTLQCYSELDNQQDFFTSCAKTHISHFSVTRCKLTIVRVHNVGSKLNLRCDEWSCRIYSVSLCRITLYFPIIQHFQCQKLI